MTNPSGTETLTARRSTAGHIRFYLDRCRWNRSSGLSWQGHEAVAHDVLEHINGPDKIGSVEDELEAIGAKWFTRGYPGAFYGVSFGLLVHDIGKGALQFKRGAPLKAMHSPIEENPRCPVFLELLDALALAVTELGPAARAYYSQARPYVARGYWESVHRWRGDRHAACGQFEAIMRASYPWVHELIHQRIPEGARLLLNYGGGKATMKRTDDAASDVSLNAQTHKWWRIYSPMERHAPQQLHSMLLASAPRPDTNASTFLVSYKSPVGVQTGIQLSTCGRLMDAFRVDHWPRRLKQH
jgi:hypothetical protein